MECLQRHYTLTTLNKERNENQPSTHAMTPDKTNTWGSTQGYDTYMSAGIWRLPCVTSGSNNCLKAVYDSLSPLCGISDPLGCLMWAICVLWAWETKTVGWSAWRLRAINSPDREQIHGFEKGCTQGICYAQNVQIPRREKVPVEQIPSSVSCTRNIYPHSRYTP